MTRCQQCRREMSRTRLRCPRCWCWNGAHPLIIVGKVLAVGLLTLAVWFIVRLVAGTDDRAVRGIEPLPGQEPARIRLVSPPAEPPLQDPRFAQ